MAVAQGSLPSPVFISLQTQSLPPSLVSHVSKINGLHDPFESVSVSLVVVGPPPSPSATISLISLLPPALDAASRGGQQAGLRGVEGQRLHHAGTHRKGQRQGTLWKEGVGTGYQCVPLP